MGSTRRTFSGDRQALPGGADTNPTPAPD